MVTVRMRLSPILATRTRSPQWINNSQAFRDYASSASGRITRSLAERSSIICRIGWAADTREVNGISISGGFGKWSREFAKSCLGEGYTNGYRCRGR